MDQSLMVVLGMSIAYLASLLGMLVAWWSYNKRKKNRPDDDGKVGRENDA